ncbi:hypothetical protein ACFVS2_20675 [Brevibacillus sp. NPDC058079]|uniref:hypothetical protein n=1 Tax=Brevibacillus sp. NPDC058079 TaxID=3346330 RepID=UPI0036E32A45
MSIIRKMVNQLSDTELLKGFDEIKESRKGGTFSETGTVLSIHEKFEAAMNEELSVRTTEDAFLFEMASRYAKYINDTERKALSSFPQLQTPFQQLQQKYLSIREDHVHGDTIFFHNGKLTEHNCFNLRSELLQLFISGSYATSDDIILKKVLKFLDKENVPYTLKDGSTCFKHIINIKHLEK